MGEKMDNVIVNMPPGAVAEMIGDIISIDYPYGFESFDTGNKLAAYLHTPKISKNGDDVLYVEIEGDLAPWRGCMPHPAKVELLNNDPEIFLTIKIFPYGQGQSKIYLYSSLIKEYTDYLIHEIVKECGGLEDDDQNNKEIRLALNQLTSNLIQEAARQSTGVIKSGEFDHLTSGEREVAEKAKRFDYLRRGGEFGERQQDTNRPSKSVNKRKPWPKKGGKPWRKWAYCWKYIQADIKTGRKSESEIYREYVNKRPKEHEYHFSEKTFRKINKEK